MDAGSSFLLRGHDRVGRSRLWTSSQTRRATARSLARKAAKSGRSDVERVEGESADGSDRHRPGLGMRALLRLPVSQPIGLIGTDASRAFIRGGYLRCHHRLLWRERDRLVWVDAASRHNVPHGPPPGPDLWNCSKL